LEQEISELRARLLQGPLPKERELLLSRVNDLQPQVNQVSEAFSSGERVRFSPDVRNRIAAFTFDDPYATALGDPISLLLTKKILFPSRVSSLGIVNYRQGADRHSVGEPAYFDRVDAITQDQGFLVAVWGRLSPTEKGARIDSYLQVLTSGDPNRYVKTIQLPKAMGGGYSQCGSNPTEYCFKPSR
jgi:hypothetical protein